MRRTLFVVSALIALALSYGAGWFVASSSKATFHALFNIVVAKHILQSGLAPTSAAGFDARTMLESAVLTLGDTRRYSLSTPRRQRIDHALDEAGRLLASLPLDHAAVVPSRGPEADRQYIELRRAQLSAVIDGARARLTSGSK